MEYIILGALAVVIVLLILVMTKSGTGQSEQRELRQELQQSVQASVKNMGDMIAGNQKNASDSQGKTLELMNQSLQLQMKQLEQRLKSLESNNEQKLDAMRETMVRRLNGIQEDNNKKLENIRSTVDEKLQKTLEEKMTASFEMVSKRLEEVYKGLGEMQTIASGVGDLKKVLSNVKTRGILGEIQLGAILGEILTPEQYDTEVATVPNSKERVEFAVRLPAGEGDGFIYLPIDSKFPGDTYAALQDAYEKGEPGEIRAAYKALETVIKKSAKDIKDKYISPPSTTNFAIMFLPFEGLYAEVVNHGLVEVLQREYSVNIAGPSTMAAMLNALQMGFRTLQIQKRSQDVWEVLSAVKTEFDNFSTVFESAQKRIQQVEKDMDRLVGTRTRAIQRKLRDVQTMDRTESSQILEIGEIE